MDYLIVNFQITSKVLNPHQGGSKYNYQGSHVKRVSIMSVFKVPRSAECRSFSFRDDQKSQKSVMSEGGSESLII